MIIKTYPCLLSPNGLLVLVIEVPVHTEKELLNVEQTIHRFLRYTGFFVGVCDRAERYVGDLERMKQIVRVLLDLHAIISQGEKWDTLKHMVAVCNEELRDCPIERPSSEPLALSEVQQLRQHMQELVNIKSTGVQVVETAEVEESEEEDVDAVYDDEIFQEGESSKAYDFEGFVRECCEIGCDLKEASVTLTGSHKVWCRCLSKDIHGKLLAYLKRRFTPCRVPFEGKCIHGFAGLKVKPTELDYTEVPTQTQEFLKKFCVAAPQGKLFDPELTTKFVEWRGENRDVVEAELREVRKFLRANYPHNNLWAPDVKKCMYGYSYNKNIVKVTIMFQQRVDSFAFTIEYVASQRPTWLRMAVVRLLQYLLSLSCSGEGLLSLDSLVSNGPGHSL